LLILPTESGFGFTPTNHKICASDSPYVLMLSVPHKTQAIVSGHVPCSSFCLSINLSTTDFAAAIAAVVGIDCGSSAWIFLPLF